METEEKDLTENIDGLRSKSRMETAIAFLRKDPAAFFAPPAATEDFSGNHMFLRAYCVPHPLPKDLRYFLEICNGFKWKSFEIYGAMKEWEIQTPKYYKLHDISGVNWKFSRHEVPYNKFYHNDQDSLLLIGGAANFYYFYHENDTGYGEGCFEVYHHKHTLLHKRYENFYDLFTEEIGTVAYRQKDRKNG